MASVPWALTPESEKNPHKFLLSMLRRTWPLRVELHHSKGGPIKLSLVVPLARHKLLSCTSGTCTLWRTETEWRVWWYITTVCVCVSVCIFLCFGVISQQKLATPFPGEWVRAAEPLFNHDQVLGCRRPDEEFVGGTSGYRDPCQFPHATVFSEFFCLTYAAPSGTVPKWSWEQERLNYCIEIPSFKGLAKQPVNYIKTKQGKTRPNLKTTVAFLSGGEEVIGWNSKIIDEWDTLCVHKETLCGAYLKYPHISIRHKQQ